MDICAIHVDHSLRPNSAEDADFVMSYCKSNGIRAYKFKVDVAKLAESKKLTVEEAAREARFGVFEALLRKDVVDKIAIAHNQKDQAETILLNLFRGTGLDGASGMDLQRDQTYIRPMLHTTKSAIMAYNFANDVPYVNDQTNQDNTFSRNYIRNQILPLIEQRWPNAVQKIASFGDICAEDNKYIDSQIFDDAVLYDEREAKMPLSYFLYSDALVARMIKKALHGIGVKNDIERVHISMVMELAKHGENGKRIKLPHKITVFKEYEYLTFANREKERPTLLHKFELGTFAVPEFGEITIKKTKILDFANGNLVLDLDKLPKDAVWRFRQRGDVFEKFGGGTKKLKDFLIDKKVPIRLRDTLPVLASGNIICAIAGVEIAEHMRADENSKHLIKISVKKC